jgi:hypothetical protein
VSVVLCWVVLVPAMASSARAEKFGAIAFAPGSGRAGWSFDYDTRANAENRALANCGAGCKVVTWFKNACGALAVGHNNGYGAGWADSRAAAEQKAMGYCRANSSNCDIRRWVCTTR